MREVVTAFRCQASQANENLRVGMIACPLSSTQYSHLLPGYWFFGDVDTPVGSLGRIPAAFPPKTATGCLPRRGRAIRSQPPGYAGSGCPLLSLAQPQETNPNHALRTYSGSELRENRWGARSGLG